MFRNNIHKLLEKILNSPAATVANIESSISSQIVILLFIGKEGSTEEALTISER